MGGTCSTREEGENAYTNYIEKFKETDQLLKSYVHGSK
jgi:hypothetical protein